MTELPATIENLLTRENFYIMGNIFSIASFVLSIFVLWNIRKLRSTYRLRVRGPSLIRDLSKSASNLSSYLNEYSDSIPQIAEELAKIGGKLRSLESKVTGRPRASVKRARSYIDQCEASAENESEVRRAYVAVITVTEELKDHQKDLDWEV